MDKVGISCGQWLTNEQVFGLNERTVVRRTHVRQTFVRCQVPGNSAPKSLSEGSRAATTFHRLRVCHTPEETDSHDRSFRPAPQTTFRPRTVDDPSLTPMQRPVLAIVPARDEAPAEVAPLAAVYRLPVADQANVYRRRRLAALAIVAGLVLGVVSFMQQADATPTPKASSPSRSASSCSPATPCGVSQVPWHRRVIPEHSSTSSAILPVIPIQPGQQLVVPLHWLD